MTLSVFRSSHAWWNRECLQSFVPFSLGSGKRQVLVSDDSLVMQQPCQTRGCQNKIRFALEIAMIGGNRDGIFCSIGKVCHGVFCKSTKAL
jgi:hypothetical protein